MTFEQQLLKLRPSLIAYARRLTNGHPDDTDDLVQETLCRAWGARATFTRGTNLWGWTTSIMHNYFVGLCRRKRIVQMTTLDDAQNPIILPGVPGSQEEHMALTEALQAMERLPKPQREALRLIGIERYSYDEAAKMMGVPIGTVKSRATRGRLAIELMLSEPLEVHGHA